NLDYSVVANHSAATAGATALVVIQGNTLNLNRGAFTGNTKDINTSGIPAGTITGLSTMSTVASAGFVSAGAPNYDYHITMTSALRGLATGSTMPVDMDYQPRADGLRDLGADEFVDGTCTPGGAADTDFDGIPDAVEQNEGTRPCAKDNDVFASTRLFLMQQYRDFFGREYDIDSFLSWMGSMAAGTSADAVIKSFSDSPEFQGVVPPIIRLYLAYFNRIPD